MARTLPPAILSALQSSGQQPYYSVTIQDLIPRYSTFAQAPSTGRSATLTTSAATILRAVTDDSNNLLIQRITDPTQASQWAAAYTTIASGVAQSAAGCCLVQTGSTIRLFYQRVSDSAIAYRDSTNDGQSWGAEVRTANPPIVVGQLCYGICADSITRFWSIWNAYSYAASVIYKCTFSGGVWTFTNEPVNTGGKWRGIECQKVGGTIYFACGYTAIDALTGVAVATFTYNGTSYSSPSVVLPMDNGNIGITLSFPGLWWDGQSTWYLTALYYDDGTTSGKVQRRLQLLTSADFVSWSDYAHFGTNWYKNAHATIYGTTLYVFDGSTCVTAPAGPALTDVSGDTLSIAITERGSEPAHLTLTLWNGNGQYNNHPSVRADARITVAFGYGTTLLVTHLFVIDTFTYQAAAGVDELTIQARSLTKLLDYPQSRFLVYQSQTISQLITAICKAAGVQLAPLPSTSQFSQTVPCFVISPGETWLAALDRLSAIYGFDHFSDSAPQIRVVERQVTDPSTWSYGTEAFGLAWGGSADQANAIRVVGQATSPTATQPVFCDTFDPTNILAEGRERFRNIVDRQLDTSAKCALRGQLALREEQMNASHGELIVTINPQHELFDVVTISDASLALSAQPARIHAIDWHAQPNTGTWEMRLELSGV